MIILFISFFKFHVKWSSMSPKLILHQWSSLLLIAVNIVMLVFTFANCITASILSYNYVIGLLFNRILKDNLKFNHSSISNLVVVVAATHATIMAPFVIPFAPFPFAIPIHISSNNLQNNSLKLFYLELYYLLFTNNYLLLKKITHFFK